MVNFTTMAGAALSSAIIGLQAGIYVEAKNNVQPITIKYEQHIIESDNDDSYNKRIVAIVETIEREREAAKQQEIRCLAENIYFEARGEPIKGQKAVAFVTLNRLNTEGFPNTICDVVWEANQFSWTKKDDLTIKEQDAWRLAEFIARDTIAHYESMPDPTNGALFFHEESINPYWSKSFSLKAKIGKHKFYG